jgi:hypothetical protein
MAPTRSCEDCKQLIGLASACTHPYARIEGVVRAREGEYEPGKAFACDMSASGERCYDCGVLAGKVHHFGCEAERCPACNEAIATCGCEVERLERP